MKHPLQDVVVVLPGIMGSALADESGHEVWGTSLGTLAKGVLTGARAIKRLQLPPGIGDAAAPDGVVATHLLDDIPRDPRDLVGDDRLRPPDAVVSRPFDVVRGRRRLTRSQPRRLPYDWRLSNRASARALKAFVEPMLERFRAEPGHADAKVVFVPTRWAASWSATSPTCSAATRSRAR